MTGSMATQLHNRGQQQTATRPLHGPTPHRSGRPANFVVRPFQWLEPRIADRRRDAEAFGSNLGYLQILTAHDDLRIARSLVEHSLRRMHSRFAPPITQVNRRLRAARLWLNAVLAGDVSPRTLGHVRDAWLPILSGVDDGDTLDPQEGRDTVEFLRGALCASIFDRPWPSLLRQARALHALETVLGAHLQAVLDR